MGYFNINSILYNLRKIFKYLSFSLLIVAFVVLALLLIGKDVHAAGEDRIFTTPPQPVIDYLENTTEYNSGNYEFFIFQNGQSVFTITLIEKSQLSSNLVCYMTGTTSYRFNNAFSYKQYSVNPNGQYLNETSNVSNINSVWGASYNANGIYYWYSSFDVYSDSTYHTILYTGVGTPDVPIEEPVFENYEDTEHFGNTLVNGEFTYFYFKIPHVEEPFTPFWFYFHDITDVPIPSDDYYNGSTSVFINLNDAVSNSVGLNYIYRYLTQDGYDYYAVPSVSPFGSYLNGHTYRLVLEWTYDSGVTADSKSFQWTTDFSQAGITKQDENKNDAMLSGINSLYKSQQEMNNFLNDNSYNSNNNMPNSSEYTSPTDSGIDSIFTALYNAFTTNQTQTVRFVIPFTNEQYIDIPSDLITSRLPQVIIILIQSVYWYVICRYIVKDIASIAEKAKSGEILDGSSDGNIKTDLL